MTRFAKLCALGLLLGVSTSALAASTMLDAIGIGTTYGEARADAISQVEAQCAAMGGAIWNFEVVNASTPGGNWHVHVLAECRH